MISKKKLRVKDRKMLTFERKINCFQKRKEKMFQVRHNCLVIKIVIAWLYIDF